MTNVTVFSVNQRKESNENFRLILQSFAQITCLFVQLANIVVV